MKCGRKRIDDDDDAPNQKQKNKTLTCVDEAGADVGDETACARVLLAFLVERGEEERCCEFLFREEEKN